MRKHRQAGGMNLNSTIMIVDDEKMVTSTLSALIKMVLKQSVLAYNNPVEALEQIHPNQQVDLIISDFMMPHMNGLEFLKEVKKKSPETVAILLTGYADKENAIRSINEVGLYYYLEKPWDNTSLIKIVQNGLEKKKLTDSLKEKYTELENSNREILRLYDMLKKDYTREIDSVKNLVMSLANVIEAKDQYTDGHTRRVGAISRILGEKLGLDHDTLEYLEIAGIIHDIGKISIPESILNKPGKLTEDEFACITGHPAVGERICMPLNCLKPCLDGIRHHHEKLDGSGYPDGLKGSEISLEARILCVADIFDALYSDRPYRSRLPLDKVKEIIRSDAQSGKLDIQVVELLFKLMDSGELDRVLADYQ